MRGITEEADGSNEVDASDEDFKDEQSASEDNNEEEEEADQDVVVSEYAGNKRIHADRYVPYWDQSRENYH